MKSPSVMPASRGICYEDPKWFVNAHIQDLDGDWPMFYLDDLSSKEAMISRAEWYFDQLFTDTAVTDVMLCAFEQVSYIASDTVEWIHEKMAQRVRNNGHIPSGYKSLTVRGYDLYNALTAYGVDWYQLAIDYCKGAGVRPWTYLRMNDHHCIERADSLFHDAFWHKARANGWLIGNEKIYGKNIANAYDFAHKEVRDWMLAYIREVTRKYDTFGLQLDFMRESFCFDYLHNPHKVEIMNGFIRDVAAIVKEAEAIHGHNMKLMIRLGVDVKHNLVYGFDVAQWAKEGIIDAVVPSPRWWATDSGIPIADWVEAVGDDVAIFPGFEYCLMDPVKINYTQVKGIAAGYMAQGAHGIYFNNFYQLGDAGVRDVHLLNPGKVAEGPRTYVMTYQDQVPIGQTGYRPLPIHLRGGTTFTVHMGPVRATESITLSIGYNLGILKQPPWEITLNGIAPVEAKKVAINPDSTAGHYITRKNKKSKAKILVQYTFQNLSTEDVLEISIPAADAIAVSLEINVNPN